MLNPAQRAFLEFVRDGRVFIATWRKDGLEVADAAGSALLAPTDQTGIRGMIKPPSPADNRNCVYVLTPRGHAALGEFDTERAVAA